MALPENLAAASTAVIASLESCLKARRISVSRLDVNDQERKLTQKRTSELELERCLAGLHGALRDMMPISSTGMSSAISPASAAVLMIPFPTLLQTTMRPSKDNVNPDVKLQWPPRIVELAAGCLLSAARITAGGMIVALALAPITTFSNNGFVSALTSLACIVLAVEPQKKEDGTSSPIVSSSDTDALQSVCLDCIASLLLYRDRDGAGDVIVAPAAAAAWEKAETTLVEAGHGNFIAMIIQAARTVLRTSKYGGARRAALSVFEGFQGFFMGGEGGVRRELWKRILPGTFSCFYYVALHSTHASEALRALECMFVLLRHVFTPISLLTNTTDKQEQGENDVLDDFASLSALANSTQSSEVENVRSSARLDIDEDDDHCDSDGLSARLDEVLPSLLCHCRRSNRPRVRSSIIRGSSMLLQIKSGGGDDKDVLVLGPKSISAAFETLLVMRWDCIPDVAREAKEGLEKYRLSLSQKEWQNIRSLSIDRILTICDALPHMVGSVSEDRLVQQLNLLASHIELLREDVGLVFKVGSTTVFNSLGKILELDMGAYASTGQGTLILENLPSSLSHKGDSSLMEESSTTTISSSTASLLYPTSYQRKYLLHCRESQTWIAIKRTLRTIGRYVDPKLLSDALEMHLFARSIENEPKSSPGMPLVPRQEHLSWVKRGQSACLVVAEALMGISSSSSGLIPKQVLDGIVRTVLRSDAWQLPLSAHSSLFAGSTPLLSTTSSLITSDMVNANVVLVSLMLQVIGAVVTAAKKEDLQDCMMELIYPLLEKATAETLQVKQAALCTLGCVASALEIPDLRSLLRDHMDYIVDELVARLDEGPGSPEEEEFLSARYIQSGWFSSSSSYMNLSGIVLALLKYSGQHTMTPLLKDLKRAVLKQVDATWWSPDAAIANVAVMQSLVESLNMSDVILAIKTTMPGIREVNNIQEKMEELNGTKDNTWFKQLALDYGEPEGADQESLKGVFDVEGADNPDLDDFDDVLEEGHDTTREKHAKFVSSCPETVLLLDILDRCSLFINMPSPSLSVDVATCVGVCWSKLAQLRADSVLLPSVHNLWPALMGRLSSLENLSTEGRFAGPPLLTAAVGLNNNRERGGETTCVLLALHPLLGIVSSLAGICGDFLSLKIKEDLWPMLKRFTQTLLHAKSASNVEHMASDDSLAGATIEKGLRAVLSCLNILCNEDGCHQFMSQLAYEVAESVAFPILEVCPSEAVLLLKSLQRLDGDGLWFLLWQTGSINVKRKCLGHDSCSSAADGSKEEVLFGLLVENLPNPIPPPSIVNRFKKYRHVLEGIV